MRAIGEFEVKGTFDDDPVNLNLTAYRDNIKKSKDKGLKASVLRCLDQSKKLAKNIIAQFKDNPELTKRIAAGALTLVIMTSLAGCKMEPKADVIEQTQIEQIEELEQTGNIPYTIKHGDTLEEIANRYTNFSALEAEVAKICKDNNIENANRIYAGQNINLDVPISKLDIFGYTYTTGELNEYDSIAYFVHEAFNVPESEIHPQNIVFWRDKQYVVGLGNENPHDLAPKSELPILYQAYKAMDDLEIMQNDQIGFYSEDDIKIKENAINSYLNEAVSIAERVTGKKYGEDYILEPPIEVVPLELGKTK